MRVKLICGNCISCLVSSIQEKQDIALRLLTLKLGHAAFKQLPESQKKIIDLFVLGGCCGHKDLNAFKYGVVEMAAAWGQHGKEPPVLLANKANTAVIELGEDADSAAVQNAIEGSSRGGVKLTSLAGALFNNKFEGKGYQDIHNIFMREKKMELHDVSREEKFPDTSNVRYQSHSYAAATLVTYLSLYEELIAQVCDSKQKPGLNHVEKNVSKGLKCAGTITELIAMALYGVCVSWPYLRIVRGTSGQLINLLDLSEVHLKLPSFCEQIAENPLCILDDTKPLADITLDGLPVMDPMLVSAASQLAPDLPDLSLILSAMFRGAARGWRRFTTEFQPGGAIEGLSDQERSLVFIPSTNDVNEGALGSFRVFIRYHPHATVASFTDRTRVLRNNTENFILKHCNHEDQQHVMRLVRKQDASGVNAAFRSELIAHQLERANHERIRREVNQAHEREEIERLISIGLVGDRDHILILTNKQLDDQIRIYRKILQDKTLIDAKLKDLTKKALKQSAVLAALTRNEEYAAISLL